MHIEGQREREGRALGWRRAVRRGRRAVVRVLHPIRWIVVGIGGVVAVLLGSWGLHDIGKNPTDSFYGSLQMFTLNGENQAGNWQLEVARLLAPVVFGSAGITAFAALFRDRWQQMRATRMTDHVVICGLGYVGGVFMRNIREAGDPVVVIESDGTNPNIELCRRSGVPVVVGDAQLRRTLENAGVSRAAQVIAVCDWDAVNTEIVANAREITRDPKLEPLQCLARIADPELCQMIRIEESSTADPSASIDFFNTDDVSARLLLDAHPLDINCGTPHILIAHLEDLGAALARHAAWDWHEKRKDGDLTRLTITVVDDDAKARIARLIAAHPDIEKVCTLRRLDLTGSGFQEVDDEEAAKPPEINRAYVTAYRDEYGVETALRLRHAAPDLPLVVALSRGHGVARMVHGAQKGREVPTVSVFRTLATTCTADLVKGGSYETIARAIHRNYCDTKLRLDREAAVQTWDQLSATLKKSNRSQARDMFNKLGEVNCGVEPLRNWDEPLLEFSAEDVEILATLEHARYMRETGRRHAPFAESTARYPAAYQELSEQIKEFDRAAVRAIPVILASVGLRVRKRDTRGR